MLHYVFYLLLILLLGNFIYLYYKYYNIAMKLSQSLFNIIIHIKFVYEKMKMIDRNGAFESNDSVGFIFKSLKELIDSFEMYNDIINITENDNASQEKR